MKLGLRLKIELLLIGFVISLGAVALGVFLAFQNGLVKNSVQRDATRATDVLSRYVEQHSADMATFTGMVADLPTLKQAVIGSNDPLTVHEVFKPYQKKLRVDSFVITDDIGKVITLDGPLPKGAGSVHFPGMDDALNMKPWKGVLSQGGHLYLGATVPMVDHTYLKATISVYVEIDAAVAKEIGMNLAADVAFVQGRQVLGASIPTASSINVNESGVIDVWSNHRRYVGIYAPFPNAPAARHAGFITLRPYAELVAPFQDTKLALCAALFLVLLLAIGFARTIAGRILANVDGLVQAARTVKDGEWPEPFDVKRTDEIGLLQTVFNEMTGSMKASQERLLSMMNYIEETNRTLEKRVADRTLELQDALQRAEQASRAKASSWLT